MNNSLVLKVRNNSSLQRLLSANPILSAKIRVLTSSYNERSLLRYFKVCKDWIFVDTGAYVGTYTRWASKRVGKKGIVIAIEASPSNFKQLTYNVGGLANVRLVQAAAWSKNTDLSLNLSGPDSPATNSVVQKNHMTHSITVKAVTIDSLLVSMNIPRIDAVKIDVEGAELEVLKGMLNSLADVKFVCIELHDAKIVNDILLILSSFNAFLVGNHLFGYRKEHN